MEYNVADGALGAGFVLGPSDPCRHHRRRVMRSHRPVGLVEDDLALPGVLGDAGFEVVGHYHGYGAAEEPEHAHVAAQPGVLGHVQDGLDVGVPAERKGSHEQVDLRHPAGHGVHGRHRGPRPIDLAHAPRLVADPAGHLLGYGEVAVSPAEPVVAHRHHAGFPADVPVLGVEQLQGDADLRHIPVDVFPVGLLEHAFMVVPVREHHGCSCPGTASCALRCREGPRRRRR